MIIVLEPSVDNNKLDLWMLHSSLPMDTVQVADVLAFKVVIRSVAIAIIRHFIMLTL